MALTERLSELVRAGFAGIWITSFEHDEAVREIAQLCRERSWRLATWDIDKGLIVMGSTPAPLSATASDPLAAIRAAAALASSDQSSLLVLKNFHRFLQSAEIVQALEHQLADGKRTGSFTIVLSPIVQIPVELEKHFVIVDHDLPGPEQLRTIAEELASEPDDLPKGERFETLLDAAAGLARYEAEGAFSLSLVRKGKIDTDAVWELKSQTLLKSGLLSLHRSNDDFSSIGGLSALKTFCKRSLDRKRTANPSCRPRGVLLLGVSGTGKSALAKALGKETGRPTLVLDIGALMGSLVGQTEQNVRKALQIADAMAPCILFCDEIEKALGGVQSGAGDSGVSSRLFGTLLTWMNDHTSDVYLIATCNDVSKLPPEFARAERFDGIFFLDLPGRDEKDAIWRLHRELFDIDAKSKRPDDDRWTGAEIRACCRLAALLDIPLMESAQQIVPVAKTAEDSVERLRQWAANRCLDAASPGIYTTAVPGTPPRRRIEFGASNN